MLAISEGEPSFSLDRLELSSRLSFCEAHFLAEPLDFLKLRRFVIETIVRIAEDVVVCGPKLAADKALVVQPVVLEPF